MNIARSPRPFGSRDKIGYMLGNVANDFTFIFASLFLTVFYTDVLKIPAALAGTMFLIARLVDALTDTAMGRIADRVPSGKGGKFKPWLVIGILSTAVVVYLAFNTNLQGWSFIAFFGVIYFLYSITYTMHDISYWGMVSALSSDPHMRDSLTSRTNLFAGIGGVIASILIPMLTTGSGTLGGSTATAYGRVSLVICILAPLFLCATVFGVRERRDYNTKEVPPVSFKKIWSTITGNPQILWISLVFLLQQIGNGVVMGGLGSTYVYFAFGYEGGLYSLFNTVGLAATALLLILSPHVPAFPCSKGHSHGSQSIWACGLCHHIFDGCGHFLYTLTYDKLYSCRIYSSIKDPDFTFVIPCYVFIAEHERQIFICSFHGYTI